ncbi:DNA translocase FtsK [uncultured Brevundimonas sp.]|uniref:DNA translocase FtsK n=1 Tax=uncultured Brevundimonas sp. TaxID=213418 RepID=UPI002606B159|nr:DNA translocase FtsK [uncultured Brevundimonas sp.]
MTAAALVERAWTTFRIVWAAPFAVRVRGIVQAVIAALVLVAMASWNAADPSWNTASAQPVKNWLGGGGAVLSDILLQSLGIGAWLGVLLFGAFGVGIALGDSVPHRLHPTRMRIFAAVSGVLLASSALSSLAAPGVWPLAAGMGGNWGDGLIGLTSKGLSAIHVPYARLILGAVFGVLALWALGFTLGLRLRDVYETAGWAAEKGATVRVARPEKAAKAGRGAKPAKAQQAQRKPRHVLPEQFDDEPEAAVAAPAGREPPHPPISVAPTSGSQADEDDFSPPWEDPSPVAPPSAKQTRAAEPKVSATKAPKPAVDVDQQTFRFEHEGGFELPSLGILAKPQNRGGTVDEQALKANAKMLEEVLQEFGVRGSIDQIRPGPVVTLYELVPAPGVKHGRVVALADDIARSMSAQACRISVVQGRNAIGIELPNAKRETVFLRDLLASSEYDKKSHLLPLALGETIGGEPYVADLARMPHLLIAGTTGSGKSVGVNAMILSILYRYSPADCRFIMIDPKMLELSVYDGIPHLLAPVVTDPKKAVVALKWTVREMEDRYRRMSKLGVRNVAGYNERAREAQEKGEHFERTVQTGFDEQGRPIYESEKIRPEPMPYLVVVMDEMADLMLVAGKEVEGAVQRLAQMARAAGIHLIMATQRPSVDVITGTIKANFPTRISFQVTSKIDSRTILGEQGGEQLLGQGDMLYMAGGGRITRLHGPFVGDQEVEEVCKHLRMQAEPEYLDLITDEPDGDGDGAFGDEGGGGSGDDLYDRAVAIVTRDRKASTSYVQRRLQIGYNRAATLIERMEQEGVVTPANHAGKREVLAGPPPIV